MLRLHQRTKNFDPLTDNENNNNLEISIYLDNLNPPYKNALFCDEFWTSWLSEAS